VEESVEEREKRAENRAEKRAENRTEKRNQEEKGNLGEENKNFIEWLYFIKLNYLFIKKLKKLFL